MKSERRKEVEDQDVFLEGVETEFNLATPRSENQSSYHLVVVQYPDDSRAALSGLPRLSPGRESPSKSTAADRNLWEDQDGCSPFLPVRQDVSFPR